MKLLRIFKKDEIVLDHDDKDRLEFLEREAYFKEALRLAKERGIKKARDKYGK